MKHWKLLLALFAAAPFFMACSDDDEDEVAPSVTLSQSTLSFEKGTSSQTVSVTSTRDWTASTEADWIAVSPASGKSSKNAQQVTITVLDNNSYDRTGTVTFNGVATASLTVNQAGTGSIYSGSGTQADPYNVAAALQLIKGLDDDVQTDVIYVKGIICTYDASSNEKAIAQYGNATYYISDDGKAGDNQLYIYQSNYLANSKFNSTDQIKVGDEVIICGKFVNYKGNTPESVSKGGSYLYSLNGKTEGETFETKTVTVAEFIAAAVSATQPYQLTGTVGGSINTQYGNFDLTDATGTVYVYGLTATNLGYGAKNDNSYASLGINAGDEVTLIGYRGEYNNKVEVIYAYHVSHKSNGTTPSTDTPSGSGTLASPYNPKAAYDAAAALAADATSDSDVYIKGKISSIKYTFSAQYGTATFNISEDGTTNGTQLPCYSVLYLGNKKWVEGNTQIAVGDEVVICGKLTNYKGNTPETASQKAYVYSLNGKTSDGGSGDDDNKDTGVAKGTGTQADPYNAAGANAAGANLGSNKVENVYVSGIVSQVSGFNSKYGEINYYISDDGTTKSAQFYVYNGYGLDGAKFTAQSDLKVGSKVTVVGTLMNYNGVSEFQYGSKIVSLDTSGVKDDGGDSGDSGQTTDGDFASNVTWTVGTNAYSDATSTINGVANVATLKLGTSSKTGTATIVLPKGTKTLTYYGVSWKNKAATLSVKQGETELFSQALAANDGATQNAPYKITVTSSDHYTYTFNTALTEDTTVTVTTTGTNTRIILFGVKAQ